MLVLGLGKVSSIKRPQGAHANEHCLKLSNTRTHLQNAYAKDCYFCQAAVKEGECTLGLGF